MYQQTFNAIILAIEANGWYSERTLFLAEQWRILLCFRKGWFAVHVRIVFDKATSTITVSRSRGIPIYRTICSRVVTGDEKLPSLARGTIETIEKARA